MNLQIGSTLPSDSALYTALSVGRNQWTVAEYPAGNHISVAIPPSSPAVQAMTLGVSMGLQEYPVSNIENDVLPRLWAARTDIERLLMAG